MAASWVDSPAPARRAGHADKPTDRAHQLRPPSDRLGGPFWNGRRFLNPWRLIVTSRSRQAVRAPAGAPQGACQWLQPDESGR